MHFWYQLKCLSGIEHLVQILNVFFSSFFTEHSNYFGTDDKLGPVAVSIRREKLEDTKDLKDQYQYRLIVRTSEVCTICRQCVVWMFEC